jgi:hypothetical protein
VEDKEEWEEEEVIMEDKEVLLEGMESMVGKVEMDKEEEMAVWEDKAEEEEMEDKEGEMVDKEEMAVWED